MRGRRTREEERELLLEAFLGGWQAALGRYVNPRARAVVEACFDLWLEEAADEVEILGLPFRRRAGLPQRLLADLRFDLATGEPLDGAGRPAGPPDRVPALPPEEPNAAGAPSTSPSKGPLVVPGAPDGLAVRLPRQRRTRRGRRAPVPDARPLVGAGAASSDGTPPTAAERVGGADGSAIARDRQE